MECDGGGKCIQRRTSFGVLSFFRDNGCQYLQFTPIVERLTEHEDGRTLASLADVSHEDNYEDVGNAKNRKKIRKSQLPISQ